MIYAKVIEDSMWEGIRLTTIEINLPKFLDAEFEKHRMISSSSSSDRAIPWHKTVAADPYFPEDIRAAGSGMQNVEMADPDSVKAFLSTLRVLRTVTGNALSAYVGTIHKQHLNRLLLPWAMQKKIATATEDQWRYFLSLRDEAGADPAMQQVARCIRWALDNHTPVELIPGQWHLPYVTGEDRGHGDAPRISAARCARVSFLNHDGTVADIEKDLARADQLQRDRHWTPFEHQGSPMRHIRDVWSDAGQTHITRDGRLWSANFHGWIQHRKLIDGGI